jgi:hypothetical protein
LGTPAKAWTKWSSLRPKAIWTTWSASTNSEFFAVKFS